MSYDLMVFKQESAPKTRTAFMKWYHDQTEWTEKHNYNDPANTSAELSNWFMEMIKTFPAMNGPFASEDDDNPNLSDYSIGNDIIYVAFAWSVAEQAYKTMISSAAKYRVGFFNVSSDNGEILFPDSGELRPIDSSQNNLTSRQGQERKPWWKLW